MSKIKLTGSNSGYVEISSAADAGNLTLSLPTAGTALLSNAGNVFTGITTFTGVNITDDITFNGASYNVVWDKSDNQLEFGDNAKISFGASSDLQIFHDGNNSFINEVGNGSLYVRAQNTFNLQKAGTSDFMLKTTTDGAVDLYFANSKKFETTNTGVIIAGICTATSFKGDGSQLSNLPASAPVGGSSSNKVFFENDKVISVNYQITSTKNAMTAGPVSVNAGIAVTVPSGCSWTIV